MLVADREFVEMVKTPQLTAAAATVPQDRSIEQVIAYMQLQEADTMLDNAKEHNVAFLVVGDPFG